LREEGKNHVRIEAPLHAAVTLDSATGGNQFMVKIERGSEPAAMAPPERPAPQPAAVETSQQPSHEKELNPEDYIVKPWPGYGDEEESPISGQEDLEPEPEKESEQPYPRIPPTTRETDAPATAKTIEDVLYRVQQGSLQVLLKTDGVIGSYTYFTLDNPSRLVIDLPGLGVSGERTTYEVNRMGLKQVRLGAHPNKARAVLDLDAGIPEFSFTPAKGGLIIIITPQAD